MGKFTFRKEEKLKKEKDIQELFDKGSSFYLFPFKVFFLTHPEPGSQVHQILISVSKRNFKRAVDRNLIKRRIREAYRLQKQSLAPSPPLLIGYVYTHKEILLFEEIKKRMALTFSKLPGQPSRNKDRLM
jgi:ribonuclease P protein component